MFPVYSRKKKRELFFSVLLRLFFSFLFSKCDLETKYFDYQSFYIHDATRDKTRKGIFIVHDMSTIGKMKRRQNTQKAFVFIFLTDFFFFLMNMTVVSHYIQVASGSKELPV